MHFSNSKFILPTGGILNKKTIPGIEVLIKNFSVTGKGEKIALLTNHTGIDSNLNSTVDLLKEKIKLTALLSPEHGIRGNFQAGENVPDHTDERFNLPCYSLYDQTATGNELKGSGIDKKMRTFDTSGSGKYIRKDVLENFNKIIIDIQDIGTRIYTYISTMAYLMESCKNTGIEIFVADRPNPITGGSLEGPVLEFPEFSSFVGAFSIPVRHGMTMGELAILFNNHMFDNKVNLTVIPMENWGRDMWFEDTELPWINPSPNMPTVQTANLYPGMVFFEGTNISEGRGTTQPFELIGAPWIKGFDLSTSLNKLNLEGISFKETFFKPWFSKFSGEMCSGLRIVVTDRNKFEPYRTMLYIMKEILEHYPDKFMFHSDYFDKITGNSWIRKMITMGKDPLEIIKNYTEDLNEFVREREEFLLYRS
ncbi:MAG: DUF1343 domain-containing protein [Acidobacteriota bacterium]